MIDALGLLPSQEKLVLEQSPLALRGPARKQMPTLLRRTSRFPRGETECPLSNGLTDSRPSSR